jgi:hypothetical protein
MYQYDAKKLPPISDPDWQKVETPTPWMQKTVAALRGYDTTSKGPWMFTSDGGNHVMVWRVDESLLFYVWNP